MYIFCCKSKHHRLFLLFGSKNNTAVNICVQVSLWAFSFLSGRYLGVELLDHMVMFNSLSNWQTVLKVSASFYILNALYKGYNFSTPWQQLLHMSFWFSHLSGHERSIVALIRVSLMVHEIEHLCMYLLTIYLSSLEMIQAFDRKSM